MRLQLIDAALGEPGERKEGQAWRRAEHDSRRSGELRGDVIQQAGWHELDAVERATFDSYPPV